LRFKIFQEGKEVSNFDLSGAYMFGTDGIAVRRAEINFENGHLNCGKDNLDTAGLVLLWPVKGFGKVLLPTTCLPKRERPYCLNVELARGKLMQIVNKCEDWAFFSKDGLGQKFEEARQSFIKALNSISNMPLASKLADEALSKAMVFADQLAIRQAETMFKTRVKNRGYGRGCLGITIDSEAIANPEYIEKLNELVGFVTIPINWAQIERVKGQYDFSQVDKAVLALSKKRFALGAGPLLRFEKRYIPQWLLKQKQSFEKVRESAYRFVSEAAVRYANRIRTWMVVSGLNCHNIFGFSFEQVLELTRAANMAVKNVDARMRKIIEVESPWGQYYAFLAGTIPPLIYMDMIVQSGINFDAFALKMDFGASEMAAHMRDMMQISAMLDYLAPIAKPFFIEDVCVPASGADDKSSGQEEWTHLRQAKWLGQFYKIVLSKPFVESVVYSKLADSAESGSSGTGLLTKELKAKDACKIVKQLRGIILGSQS
jgi:hypothetical protein